MDYYNGYCFVAFSGAAPGTLQIIDVDPVEEMAVVNQVVNTETYMTYNDVEIVGDKLILGCGDPFLPIYDLSDPENPSFIRDVYRGGSPGGHPAEVVYHNGYLLFSDFFTHFGVADISNPENASVIFQLDEHRSYEKDLIVDGNHAYYSCGLNILKLY